MSAAISSTHSMAVIADPRQFDNASGNLLERLIFNNRPLHHPRAACS